MAINNFDVEEFIKDNYVNFSIIKDCLPTGDYLCYCENDRGEFMYRIDHYTLENDPWAWKEKGWDGDGSSPFKVVQCRKLPTSIKEEFTGQFIKLTKNKKIFKFELERDFKGKKFNYIMFGEFIKENDNKYKLPISFLKGLETIAKDEIRIIKTENEIYVEPYITKLILEDKFDYSDMLLKNALSSPVFLESVKETFKREVK